MRAIIIVFVADREGKVRAFASLCLVAIIFEGEKRTEEVQTKWLANEFLVWKSFVCCFKIKQHPRRHRPKRAGKKARQRGFAQLNLVTFSSSRSSRSSDDPFFWTNEEKKQFAAVVLNDRRNRCTLVVALRRFAADALSESRNGGAKTHDRLVRTQIARLAKWLS